MNSRVALVLAVFLCLPWRAPAQGGTAPKTLYACYLPQSGVVYRVAESDLRSQTPLCASQNHVLFSWNDKGEKGDKGDPGEAGNLALAGRMCPPGQFVAGFSTTGDLVCSAPSTGPGGGGGLPPTAYEGRWSLGLQTTCSMPNNPLAPGTLAFTTVNTQVPTPGQINLVFFGTLSFFSHIFYVSSQELALSFNVETGAFAASTELAFSGDVVGGGAVSVSGRFQDANSIVATVTMSEVWGQLHTPLQTDDFTCDRLAMTVTGTRM